MRLIEGSFFEVDVPQGGDVYLLKGVIHDWPDDDAVRILGNVRAAAGAGKRVLLVELVLPRARSRLPGQVDGSWRCWSRCPRVSAPRTNTAGCWSVPASSMTRVVQTASPYSLVEGTAI